ncbi:MAG: lipopolysaccharide kinase InaA family protein [Planctomycetota bacterium]
MALPAGFVEVRRSREVAWIRADLEPLGLDALWAAPEPLPFAKGRGGIGQLQLRPDLCAVVRQLRRGGAFGKLLGDRYPAPARVRRELEVLTRLREEGVPVVAPLAALARRPRTFWRLRLLTELAAGAQPLPAFCAADPEARRWAIEAAAVTIRLAFAAGLRHPDLHPDNVLVSRSGDKVRAVLVDLDRAELVPVLTAQQRDTMLVRMARYLWRHRRTLPVAFTRVDLMRFLRALGEAPRAPRKLRFRELQQKLERALKQRGLLPTERG